MRLYRYLSEEDYDKEHIWDILRDECSEYVDILKDIGTGQTIVEYMLYRGTHHSPRNGISKVKPRKSRSPRDMPEEVHEILDELFENKFGWPIRSQGVFTTSDKSIAENFGRFSPLFFPADGFKFVYSKKIKDLLAELEFEGVIDKISPGRWAVNTWEGENDEHVIRTASESIVEKYTDKNLIESMKSGVEVTFGCKYYYLIEEDMIIFIVDKLMGV